jgi:hypothetical protein
MKTMYDDKSELTRLDRLRLRRERGILHHEQQKKRWLELTPPQTLRDYAECLGNEPTAEQLEALKELLLQERFALDRLLNLLNKLLSIE